MIQCGQVLGTVRVVGLNLLMQEFSSQCPVMNCVAVLVLSLQSFGIDLANFCLRTRIVWCWCHSLRVEEFLW